MSRNNKRSQRGILMFECLLAIVVLSVLLVVGVRGVRNWVAHQQAKHVAGRLDSMLFRARWLSVLHHASIRCCGSSDSLRCNGAWSKGWLLQESSVHPYFYRVDVPTLSWHAGHINQAPGITFSPEGKLASSPGHFEWISHGRLFRYVISESGVAHLQ